MKEGWVMVTLNEVCKKIQDGAHRSPQITYTEPGGERFPYITSKNIRNGYLKLDTVEYCDADFHNEIYLRCNPELGDVLLTKDGANTGNVTINTFPEPFSMLSSVCLLKPDRTKLLSRYLVYYIQSNEGLEHITGKMTGAAIKRIILKTIKSSHIPLPPLHEQKRIVAILDEAFAGIGQAIANTEKNLKNARELFESYLNDVFTRKGEGWADVILSEICDVRDGTHDSPKYIESGIPFITQKNIRAEGLNFKNTQFISDLDHSKFYKRSNVSKGDILISMIGANRGMSCLVNDDRTFSIKNVGLIKATDNIETLFLLYYLKSNIAKTYIEAESRGGAQPFIGLTKLRSFPVSLAPANVQKSIVSRLDALHLETNRLESIYQQKLKALAELKQSILQKAFTGDLTNDIPL